jgi:microcystin degradation protein MlrC
MGSAALSALVLFYSVDGIEILVVTSARQILDLQQFKAFGIDPQNKHVVALKSMQHFRAAFEPIAGQVIVCDSGALCTPRYNRLPYRNVPRPIFPLDPAQNLDKMIRVYSFRAMSVQLIFAQPQVEVHQ